MRISIHDLIEEQAALRADRPALSYRDETLSYAELGAAVTSASLGFRGLGLERHGRVGIYLEKRPETVAAIFGTSKASGIFVPINPGLKPRQVGHIITDSDIEIFVTSAERFDTLRAELAGSRSIRHIILVGDNLAVATTDEPSFEVHRWSDVCDESTTSTGLVDLLGPRVDADIATILYTSGSTGSPKGVVLTHRNLIVGAESVSQYLHNDDSDVILAALPISFDAGFSQLTTAFSVGAHAVLVNYLLPNDVVRACARHGVTGLTCVPPLWIQLTGRTWPAEATQQMRYFANTGGRMPKSTLGALRSIFPEASPYLMYGLTEAFRSTYLDPGQVDARPASIGKAIPNAEILVIGPDGNECGPGEEGELVHRGPLVALGYWNDAGRTAERFRPLPNAADWHTPEVAVWSGDTVVKDEEGYLYFVGRSDEMIKTSGYRVSPTEVEEAAYDTGRIGDAVAFGVDDDALGQRIVLVVAPATDQALDVEVLRSELVRTVPAYMVPAVIIERDELPRSPNGKFDRTALRAELDER